ncbi:MAG: DUF6311 domain-containing protein [Chloroflexi bacterium]|nr:DUF6311 domain-containing protein [Chloroflexota bacterium]MCI0645252.1 DUF6311 domain-containing protein [Chloroflexota bacterium]MCI0725324.1 DUF6311 domain-containing protein [Chloroflexota bacterium]
MNLSSTPKANLIGAPQYIPIVGLFLGGLVFLIIYGPKILNPTFIAWTMDGDAAQHFLGWHFFRSEPWTFPIGAIKSYLYPHGTSLVYTDSIPLLAIPLKLLSPLLPAVFQYHGLWLLLAYALQGYFSTLLLRRITNNPLLIFLGALFFLLSPVLVQRARVHESLAGHWIIVASLYLYFQANNFTYRMKWLILLIVAAMVHFYLLVMASIIFSAYLLRQVIENHKKITLSVITFSTTALIATAISMWLVGYFVIDIRSIDSGGFGNNSMNLLSPLNASPIDNLVGNFVFLKPFPLATTGQLFEGFNYLGFGLLLLILFAAYGFIRQKDIFSAGRYLPLILVGFALLAISLSNKITLANTVLLEIKLPYVIEKGSGIVRSSGRMFWPISYMLMLAALTIVIKYNSPKRASLLLLVFVGFQVADLSPWYRNVHFDEMSWDLPLRSHLWNQLMENADHIVFVPPNTYDADIVPFALLAATHGKTINVGTAARTNNEAREKYRAALLQEFNERNIKSNTLYIIRDEAYLFTPTPSSAFSWGILDGYAIIAPKMDSLELTPWPN